MACCKFSKLPPSLLPDPPELDSQESISFGLNVEIYGNGRIGWMSIGHVFTYIFEKVSPIHLTDHIPEHFCLKSFMYRTLQQKVQCAIDSSIMCFLFALLVSMNQLRRQAAKTAGNGVELN